MYFHRISLNRNGRDTAKTVQALQSDIYGHHQLIWQLFTDADKRRFLFRQDDADGWPRYYVVSAELPQDKLGVWQIESKEYRPRLTEGQHLLFSLRANPVVTRKDKQGKRHRHDVVMNAKNRMGFNEMPLQDRPPLNQIMNEAGLKWLADRAERHGFSFAADRVVTEGYQQHKAFKRKVQIPIKFSTLEFSGVLRVSDPKLFVQSLFQGIGPAKGFGCGMLMVRPGS